MSATATMPGTMDPGLAMEQDPRQRAPETGQPTPEAGQDIAINILDPTVPFNESGSKPVMSSILTSKRKDGSYTGIDGESVGPKEVADTIARELINARSEQKKPGSQPGQNGDPLALTAREQKIADRWEAEKAAKASASEDASDEAEDQAGSGSKGLSVGKIAAGVGGGTAAALGLGAAVDATPVDAHSNSIIPAPLAAEPFSISSKENLVPGPNGLVSTEASMSGALKQLCVRAGLRFKIRRAEMNYPGDRKLQSVVTEVKYNPMPKKCHGVFRRGGKVKVQIQDPASHRRWISYGPFKTLFSMSTDEGGIGAGGAGFFGRSKPSKDSKLIYSCTPGPEKTQVRGIYKHHVRNLTNGKTAGRRTNVVRFRVKPTPNLTPKRRNRGALARAC